MGIQEIFGALGRRWYVVVVGVLVTLGAGWQLYQTTPPEYTARSLVLLLPPQGDVTAPEAVGVNPFLELAGLDLTARVVIATYTSTAFEEELAEVSPDAEVEVNIDDSTRGGVIAVVAKDRGEAQTLRTLEYVTASVSERLASLQKEVGVADIDAVRSMQLATDTEATRDFQSLIRLLVIVVGAGFGVTFVLALVLDVVLVRRQRRGFMVRRERPSWFWKRKSAAVQGAADETEPTSSTGRSPRLPDLDDDSSSPNGAPRPRSGRRRAPASPRPAPRQDTRP
ncbi:hypothetical protein [Microbacterium sp. CGR1]|uniref:hypothetical protein n=1 Tax=Microbacterium sp. CGR1 TaxID=1696072 RepID=UPI003DA1D71A